MRAAQRRGWSVVAAVVLALAAAVPASRAEEPAPAPAVPDIGLPSLASLAGDAVDLDEVLGAGGLGRWRVPAGIRVLVVSSGVHGATFGEAYTPQLAAAKGDGDRVGLGTYAASVLFQVAPAAHLTTFGVYRDERVDAGAVAEALEWAQEHAADLDAVLLAFPPAAVLDPVSAGMASGAWPAMADPAEPESGQLKQLSERWTAMRSAIAALAAAGVTVVAPAGDIGPGPQSVLGLAGLPEVLTVGAFDGRSVARVSASGPSLHGGVKPDLVAPTGLPGLVPEESALSALPGAAGGVTRTAALELPVPAAGGRQVALGSTIPAAAVAAASVAQLRVDGVTDPAAVRGVFTAAAAPIGDVPAWRQGAGALRDRPTADLARSRPLVGAPADLGAEPGDGPWTTVIPTVGGGLASGAAPAGHFPDRIETTPQGGRAAVAAGPGEARPVPGVEATDGGLRFTLPAGDNPWATGAWCGYLAVPLTGLAELVEDIPACLVEGLGLTAFNFYIHDLPAENQTFALLPALPPGAGLLDGPLHVLPLDPLHEPLYAGVSGPDGLVHFPAVPPAFFVMRQFSDYGAPVVEDLPPATAEGKPARRQRDLGEAASYLSYDALVLPNPCPERIRDHQADGTPCHRAWLEGHFAGAAVGYDRTTTRYLVDTPAGRIGVVFDFTKKFAGVGVSSRYVDLLAHDDLTHGSAVSLDEIGTGLAQAWSFQPAGAVGDPEGTLALYKGLDLEHDPASLAGTSTYEFGLTTPNYKGTMSLNFGYDIEDAVAGVIVRVGDEVHTAVITPAGTIEPPAIGTDQLGVEIPEQVRALRAAVAKKQPAIPDDVNLLGPARGQASFDFHIKPGGADHGTLTFLYVPLDPARPAGIHIGGLSFEITTWQRIDWPPAELDRGGRILHGHTFAFDSNYRAEQMDHPGCRQIDNGTSAADVCENWQVLVHSPVDDAETYELLDVASGKGFLAELGAAGGGFHHPHRGVHGERVGVALAGVTLPIGRGVVTNGRFWEQLVVPAGVLAAHPGPVEVRLEDNVAGSTSTLLTHADGPVPLAPYVAFRRWHEKTGAGLLDPGGAQGVDRVADRLAEHRMLGLEAQLRPAERVGEMAVALLGLLPGPEPILDRFE